MSARDTKFAGFAGMVFDELDLLFRDLASERAHEDYVTADETVRNIRQMIAQRAYDFAVHIIENTGPRDLDVLSSGEHISRMPDMTSWLEEANEEK
jgi:replicative DNA helicase